MATHKIKADLDVDGEVQGTSLDINGNADIAGTLSLDDTLTVNHATSTSQLFLTGTGNGYVNAAVILQCNDDNGHTRGAGVYMNNVVGATEWFAGRPYNDGDSYQILRRHTTSGNHNNSTATAATSNTALLMDIDSAGNTVFEGNVDINGNTLTIGSASHTISYVSATTALRSSGNLEATGTFRTYSNLTVDGNAGISGTTTVGGTVLGTSAKFGRDTDNLIDFTTDNSILFRTNNADRLRLDQSQFYPVTSNGVALGSGTNMFSDLFLASGGVVNFNNSDVTITHSSNSLDVAGGTFKFTFEGDTDYNVNNLCQFVDGEDSALITFGTGSLTLAAATTTVSGILDITGTTDATDATGDTGILRCEGGASIAKKLFVGSTITGSADVIAFSDRKLKENIETLDGKKVLDMRGVSFTRKDTGAESSGVIAQEIQKVAPELVHDTNGTLGVAYGNLVGYLIEAIKDQQKQIDELKENCNGCSK